MPASLTLFGTIQHFKCKLSFLVFTVDLIEKFIIKSHKNTAASIHKNLRVNPTSHKDSLRLISIAENFFIAKKN